MTLKQFCGTRLFGLIVILVLFTPFIYCCESGETYSSNQTSKKRIRYVDSKASCLKFCYKKDRIDTHYYNSRTPVCICNNGDYYRGIINPNPELQ